MRTQTARGVPALVLILTLLSPLSSHGRKLTDADLEQLPKELGAKDFSLDRAQSFVVDLAQKGTLFVSGTALSGKHKGKLRVLLVAKRKVLLDLSAKWTTELDLARAKLRAVTFRDLDGDGIRDVALILRVKAPKGRKTTDHAYCYGWSIKAYRELRTMSERRLRLSRVVTEVLCENACTMYASCDEEVHGGTFRHGYTCTENCKKKKPKERRRWLECVFGSTCKHVVTKC